MGKEAREETKKTLWYDGLGEKENEGRKEKGKWEDKEKENGIRKERKKMA
jgi:hypothetical protein